MRMGELRPLSRVLKYARSNGLPFRCHSFRSSTPSFRTRQFATKTSDVKKPYYVTTPIFYVNAAPHIGHLYTLILADIQKRWQVLLGNKDAKLVTGTDEHGMKIQQAAAAAGVDAQDFCDANYGQFEALARAANVDYDEFIRTSSTEHKEAVRYFWEMLNHRGYIYTSKHEGWYSVSDETFYPSTSVQPILDPSTGRKLMTSIETGKEVEWSSEINYHFRLSAFKDKLLEHYKNNPDFITPSVYQDIIVNSVSSGLPDLSISRPVERLTWGVRVPGDDSQTIYVWLDALINYLTKAGYPFPPGQEGRKGWPADVHVIGKDISRFHCVYWPAFLMALDIPLPRQILTHAHWTMNHEKMSKSTGNVVNPMFALERFGIDTMRFFLAHHGGLAYDADYDNSYIIEKYKKNLQWGMGNLSSRLLRSKKWVIRDSIEWFAHGKLPDENEADKEHRLLLESLADKVKGNMDKLSARDALRDIQEVIIAKASPWNLPPRSERDAPIPADRVFFLVAESLRISAILLQPCMPEKASVLLNMLGVENEDGKRNFAAARYGSDLDYGASKVDLKKGTAGTLFPPLLSEE